ncbi:galactokinase [Caproiciproducens galactitolivorans]|uniref:Galactokinase n=1 Tax=Caproiciproducens galactitolivorans TaxID=642589 RepID=A0ABT4BRU0_9FIRM|nr:galactokinase family protein [Caproiciproducens galactitolivorans]MCY1713607.1 galactokinase [Caproiciproducens galactitolivorans]
MLSSKAKEWIANGNLDVKLAYLYVCNPDKAKDYRNRLIKAIENFEKRYGTDRDIRIFSAPGRTEVGGNHTDHQRGNVLAASVNLDVIAVVSKREDSRVQVESEGYPADTLDADDLGKKKEEKNTSSALIRGILSRYAQMGYRVGGFEAYTTSNVLSGSGLSSSAAFEVLIGTIVNDLFCGGKESALKVAQIGQYAENVYFGKPCGLMDEAASSVGGFVAIDFRDAENPTVRKVDFDFAKCGYSLCIIDTKGSHADLTPDYAAIPAEMKAVAAYFGKEVLSEVGEDAFYREIAEVRKQAGDRAVLRAIHFYADNRRAKQEAEALNRGDFETFKKLIIESGYSSYMYLQNVFSPSHVQEQGVSLTLALCQKYLDGKGGAYRVHGGGFAGTVQTFVPDGYLTEFVGKMEAVLGEGSCHVLSIRPVGGTRIL